MIKMKGRLCATLLVLALTSLLSLLPLNAWANEFFDASTWGARIVRGDRGISHAHYAQPSTPTPTTEVVDLSLGQQDLAIFGLTAYADWLGEIVAGDVNDDGIGDFIIGASGKDWPGRPDAGAVYVIFGSPDLYGPIDLSTFSADVTILGAAGGDACGHVVASGDVNGDGVDDLLIGADYADGPAGIDAGLRRSRPD